MDSNNHGNRKVMENNAKIVRMDIFVHFIFLNNWTKQETNFSARPNSFGTT